MAKKWKVQRVLASGGITRTSYADQVVAPDGSAWTVGFSEAHHEIRTIPLGNGYIRDVLVKAGEPPPIHPRAVAIVGAMNATKD